MKKPLLIPILCLLTLLLIGAPVFAAEINSGLTIDPEASLQQGSSTEGLTTYGLRVKLFTPEIQEQTAEVARIKQAALDQAIDRLFSGQKIDTTYQAQQAQQIVFSSPKTYAGQNTNEASANWALFVIIAVAMIAAGLVSYVVTQAVRKRKRS